MEEQIPKQDIEQSARGNDAYYMAHPNTVDSVERARVMAEAGDVSRTRAAATRAAAGVMVEAYTAVNGTEVLDRFDEAVDYAQVQGNSDYPRKKSALNILKSQGSGLDRFKNRNETKSGIREQTDFMLAHERQASMEENMASDRFDEAVEMRKELGIREPQQVHEVAQQNVPEQPVGPGQPRPW